MYSGSPKVKILNRLHYIDRTDYPSRIISKINNCQRFSIRSRFSQSCSYRAISSYMKGFASTSRNWHIKHSLKLHRCYGYSFRSFRHGVSQKKKNRVFLSHSFVLKSSVLGCNNGIGGIRKNAVTFRNPELPDFELTQKMDLRNYSSLMQLKRWHLWICVSKT